MRTRPELILLQKTMVVVEGVARTLNPKLNMWTTGEPVVREWMEKQLGVEGRLLEASEGASTVGKFMGTLPQLLSQAERTSQAFSHMAEHGIRLDDETVRKLGRERAPRAYGLLYALGALSFIGLTVFLAISLW